jgi:hypothetical protein
MPPKVPQPPPKFVIPEIPGFNKVCRSVYMNEEEETATQLNSFRANPAEHADCDPNAPDASGRTPVFYAALKGRPGAIKQLGLAGADCNLPSPRNRLAPIHMAAQQYGAGHKLIPDLVKYGADVNAKDASGYTPLHYCKTARAAKALCAGGADLTATDMKGLTALDHQQRNPANGDAAAVVVFLQEYSRKMEEFKDYDTNGDGELDEEELGPSPQPTAASHRAPTHRAALTRGPGGGGWPGDAAAGLRKKFYSDREIKVRAAPPTAPARAPSPSARIPPPPPPHSLSITHTHTTHTHLTATVSRGRGGAVHVHAADGYVPRRRQDNRENMCAATPSPPPWHGPPSDTARPRQTR